MASKFGLDIRDRSQNRKFWLLQPENAEQALNAILKMIKFRHPTDKGRSAFDLIVLYSIAALVTQAELGGEIGDNVVAGVARELAQFYRMAKTDLRNSQTAIVTLNQLRDDFGKGFGHGPRFREPGGRSIRFYSSIMAQMKQRPVPLIDKETGEVEGLEFKMKVTKNKVGRPGREGTFVIYLDTGTSDIILELARLGKEFGIFTKLDGSPISGATAWYFRSGDRREMVKLGVGEKQVTATLDGNRDLAAEVELAVRVAIAHLNTGDSPSDDTSEDKDEEAADDEAASRPALLDDS